LDDGTALKDDVKAMCMTYATISIYTAQEIWFGPPHQHLDGYAQEIYRHHAPEQPFMPIVILPAAPGVKSRGLYINSDAGSM
jgi:hypothetical protein